MPGNVQCFWVEPAPLAQESFRRFCWNSTGDAKCTVHPYGYHYAKVVLGDVPWENQEYRGCGNIPDDEVKKDPRWPARCVCGYEFKSEDAQYHDKDQYLRNPATGELYRLHENVPPGATFLSTWIGQDDVGPDGVGLTIILPDGVEWSMDGKASDSGRWTRTGSFPTMTVSPSIKSSRYHGFLRNGVLEPCGDSQT